MTDQDRQDDTRAREQPDEASVRARGGMRHARTPLRRVVRPRRSPPEGVKRDTVDRTAGGEPREVERRRAPGASNASPCTPLDVYCAAVSPTSFLLSRL